MTDIVFVDTETTGVHPEREIWEVAMVKRSSKGVEKDYNFQIRDVDLSKADPFGLKVGRFYDRYYQYAVNAEDISILPSIAAADLIEHVTRGCHIVGAVPNFDTESFDKLLRQNKLLPSWHYHLIDVEALAIGYLQGCHAHKPKSEQTSFKLPWKSDELSRAIGVEPPTDEERHTAMGDVLWAMRTYDRVMGIG